MNINALSAATIPVYNAQVPVEGPVAIPLSLDFTAASVYTIDGHPLTDQGFISLIQTIFVDTTDCVSNLIVSLDGSRQKISIKPNTQGYYPLVCPNPWRITFTCLQGPVGVFVILLNVPIAPGQWSVV
jgi:hypothetical protein